DDVVAEMRVTDAGAGANHTAFTKHRRSLNRDVGIDDRVAADLRVRADICMRWIDKRHAVFDHQPANGVATHQVLKLGQLSSRVNTGNFARIVVRENLDLAALRKNDLGNVSQVILTLLVLWFDALQRLEEIRRFEAVDAGVDLPDSSFFLAGV